MADLLKKISALPSGTPTDAAIIPFVEDGATQKATKADLKGEQGNAATADAGTTTTLAAGESATVTNVGTTSAAIFNFAIPQGIQGLTGANGACVESVSFVGNDMVFVLDDASTVNLTNAKTDLKGDTGAKIVSGAFVGDDLVFTLDDNSTATVTNAKVDLKGDQGIQGIQGIQGVAGTNGTNGTNGTDGEDGISFIWEDAYVAETTYQTNDVVSYNGSSYICILESTGNLPTNATYWSLMAQKGTDGTGSGDISGSGTANELAYFTAEKTIDNLAVATYPSLTEVSYVKGVTSAIQTQLGDRELITNKENTTLDTSTTKYPTNRLTKEYADGKVEDNITDGHTTIAPSGNAVFDALAEKVSLTGTETLTNKRITPRVISATSYTTDTGTSLDVSTCDQFQITAQAGALKFNNPGGTPLGGQKLIIRIKDDGTARALTYDTQFRAIGNALPTTTVLSKTLYMGFIYNATDTKWDLVAVAQEA